MLYVNSIKAKKYSLGTRNTQHILVGVKKLSTKINTLITSINKKLSTAKLPTIRRVTVGEIQTYKFGFYSVERETVHDLIDLYCRFERAKEEIDMTKNDFDRLQTHLKEDIRFITNYSYHCGQDQKLANRRIRLLQDKLYQII
jgi:hypothetical protein